jgi:hypothetical protein
MNGERHRLALLLRGEADGGSVAVLNRVADEIRDDLSESVNIPLAAQIAAGLKPQDCLSTAGTDFDDRFLAHLPKVGGAPLERIDPPNLARVRSRRSPIIRSMRCALFIIRATTRPRRCGLSSGTARSAAPAITAPSGVRRSWPRTPIN